MNRHLSVLALAARQTIGKVLALLAAMAAGEAGLFAWALSRGLPRGVCFFLPPGGKPPRGAGPGRPPGDKHPSPGAEPPKIAFPPARR